MGLRLKHAGPGDEKQLRRADRDRASGEGVGVRHREQDIPFALRVQAKQKPQRGPGLWRDAARYGFTIDCECVPLATATTHDGSVEVGKGELVIVDRPPVFGLICRPESELSRRFELYT